MAVIAMFYGIIISMYYFDNHKHKMPHIHVKYQGQEAVLSLPDGELLEGKLKRNKVNYHHQRWWLVVLHLEGATTLLFNRTTYLGWLRVAFPASLATLHTGESVLRQFPLC
ncbi:MAG TPA: DUF4160 domain-containing protein [Bacteroidetes bacterium]|nr:DUF4160 domain-containing protein [Bacteroidota bacterium]